MLPKWHLLISVFLFTILFFVLKVSLSSAIIIALASFLIDLDHYLFYMVKHKEYNPIKVYTHLKEIHRKVLAGELKKENRPKIFLLFHSIEFFILIFVLALFLNHTFLYLIFISFLFHFLCDLIYGLITKTFELWPYSLIYYLKK
jgi:hypothetical protein